MSLFDADEYVVCRSCGGDGNVWSNKRGGWVPCGRCAAPTVEQVEHVRTVPEPVWLKPQLPPRWPEILPDEAVIEAAKLRRAQLQAKHGYGLFESKGVAWCGHAGEVLAADWAEANGLDVVRNGGYDGKPDLVLNGVAVGVKTSSTKRRDMSRPRAIVPEDQLGHPWDYWLFLSLTHEEPHLTFVLGALPPKVFAEISAYANWVYPCRYLEAAEDRLIEPAAFLELLLP